MVTFFYHCLPFRIFLRIFADVKLDRGQDGSCLFYIFCAKNMNAQQIREQIEAAVAARGCFIVDVKVSADNDVTLAIESEEGTVVMEDCVAIDKAFHEIWDQDAEDYALTVTSAGLDQPFKVLRQYLKAVGSQVEVRLKGGRKFVAQLTAATETSVSLRYSAREAVEGSKKKVLVEHEETFPMDQVNSVTPYITFD